MKKTFCLQKLGLEFRRKTVSTVNTRCCYVLNIRLLKIRTERSENVNILRRNVMLDLDF